MWIGLLSCSAAGNPHPHLIGGGTAQVSVQVAPVNTNAKERSRRTLNVEQDVSALAVHGIKFIAPPLQGRVQNAIRAPLKKKMFDGSGPKLEGVDAGMKRYGIRRDFKHVVAGLASRQDVCATNMANRHSVHNEWQGVM